MSECVLCAACLGTCSAECVRVCVCAVFTATFGIISTRDKRSTPPATKPPGEHNRAGENFRIKSHRPGGRMCVGVCAPPPPVVAGTEAESRRRMLLPNMSGACMCIFYKICSGKLGSSSNTNCAHSISAPGARGGQRCGTYANRRCHCSITPPTDDTNNTNYSARALPHFIHITVGA